MDKGTITWVRVEDDLPPVNPKSHSGIGSLSNSVLITNNEKLIYITNATYFPNGTHAGWINTGPMAFTPTHWAYINYPEQ